MFAQAIVPGQTIDEITSATRSHFGVKFDQILRDFRQTYNLQPKQPIPARMARALEGHIAAEMTDCCCDKCINTL